MACRNGGEHMLPISTQLVPATSPSYKAKAKKPRKPGVSGDARRLQSSHAIDVLQSNLIDAFYASRRLI